MKQLLESKFIIDRKELNEALNTFKRLLKKKFDSTICNLRVMPGGNRTVNSWNYESNTW